jgi:general secretion pathway protein N
VARTPGSHPAKCPGWAAPAPCSACSSPWRLFAPARWLAAGVARRHGGPGAAAGRARHGLERLGADWCSPAAPAATTPPPCPARRLALRPRWTACAALRAECCITSPVACAPARLAAAGAARGRRRVAVAGQRAHRPGHPLEHPAAGRRLRCATQGLSVEWTEGRPASPAGRVGGERVASRLSTLRPMGSYRITLQGGTPCHGCGWRRWKAACSCPAAANGWATACASAARPRPRPSGKPRWPTS